MIISLKNVSKKFGTLTAVDSIDLVIDEGEIFGIVGPDGAGKTTAIRLILELLTKDSGTIEVMGQSKVEDLKPYLGYIPQKFSLYSDLTVIENIRFIGAMYGASKENIEKLADETLGFTNLLQFKHRLAGDLSGGMKKKLSLAAGLMHKPKLFFLDEPTTGVDPVSRREFWQLLYKLNREGMTIVISTPYMDEAELCTRIAFMNHGKIITCDSPKTLKGSYPYHVLELTVPSKSVRPYLVNCPEIIDINAFGEKYHLVVNNPEYAAEIVKDILIKAGLPVLSLRETLPTMEDIFVALAEEVSSS